MSRISTSIAAAAMFAVSDVDALRLTQVRPLDDAVKPKVNLAHSQKDEGKSIKDSFLEGNFLRRRSCPQSKASVETQHCDICDFKMELKRNEDGTYTVTASDGLRSKVEFKYELYEDKANLPSYKAILDQLVGQESTKENTKLTHAELLGGHHLLVKKSEVHGKEFFVVVNYQPDAGHEPEFCMGPVENLEGAQGFQETFQGLSVEDFAAKLQEKILAMEEMIAMETMTMSQASDKIAHIFPMILIPANKPLTTRICEYVRDLFRRIWSSRKGAPSAQATANHPDNKSQSDDKH